jgi:uncharacterized protein with NRDE domain
MNFNAITKALTLAYDAVLLGKRAFTSFKDAVDTLRPLLKDATREEAKAVIAPVWAKLYGETFEDGKWANSDCAAKRDCNRLLASIYVKASPATSAKTVVKLTRAQKAAVVALLAAFGGDAKAAKAAITA